MLSSEEASLKDLQDQAAQVFSRDQEPEKVNAVAESSKKQQNKELGSNSNLSPLARFLLSRYAKLSDLLGYL